MNVVDIITFHLLFGTRVDEDVGILKQGMRTKRQLGFAET